MIKSLAFTAAMVSSVCCAADIAVEYKNFYSHLNQLNDQSVDKLEFTFGFVHVNRQQLCDIQQVEIVTQKQTMPIEVGADKRFRLPTERALKLAKAQVLIDVEQAANQCDMSVQLQAQPKYLSSQYSGDEVRALVTQFAAFFDQMGGFLSFLMPGAQGIQMHFTQPVTVEPSLSGKSRLENKVVWLHQDDAATMESMTLSQMPYKITVWMED